MTKLVCDEIELGIFTDSFRFVTTVVERYAEISGTRRNEGRR